MENTSAYFVALPPHQEQFAAPHPARPLRCSTPRDNFTPRHATPATCRITSPNQPEPIAHVRHVCLLANTCVLPPFDQAALARRELHRLLEDEELASTPLLVLANKVDLEPHMSEDQVIRELNLDYVTANPWILIPISALKVTWAGEG